MMAKAGRHRKAGPRTPGGRLSRAHTVPVFDHGTDRARAMQVLYGPDGSDAIGRAYQANLLGEGSAAKALLDTARRIANAYWAAYSTGRYQCPLAERTFGDTGILDHESIKRREEWLAACLKMVAAMGFRPQFDALVIDVHPDSGPPFLDAVIYAQRTKSAVQPLDRQRLELAVKALTVLAS